MNKLLLAPKKRLRYVLPICMGLLIVLTLNSCGFLDLNEIFKDTCTQGDNMSNLRVVQGFDPISPSPTLIITWDTGTQRGAELPDTYFAQVKSGYAKDNPLIKDIRFNPSPKTFVLSFENLETVLSQKNSLELELLFPDREGYIDCQHPGSTDWYYLTMTLRFSQMQFLGAEFRQPIYLGPF